MRVTNHMMFSAGVVALQSQQQEMLRVQEQSASGMRVNRPSDDPSATFRHLLFSTDLSGVQSLQRTSGLASQRLAMGDGKIGTIHGSMLQAQDLVLRFAHSSAGGDTSILKAAATEAETIYQNIMTVANSELDDVPLFGGGRTITPFDESQLQATPVRFRENGTGPLEDAPLWFTNTASMMVDDTNFDQVTEGRYNISRLNGLYQLDLEGLDGFVTSMPLEVTREQGKEPILELDNGVVFTLGGTVKEGDVFSFDLARDGRRVEISPVRWQGSSGATSVSLESGFSPPFEQIGDDTFYKIVASEGKFHVTVNGIPQPKPLTATQSEGVGKPSFLTLESGAIFNMGDQAKEGDVFSFEVKFSGDSYKSTPIRLQRSGGEADRTSLYAGYRANVDPEHTLEDLPLSVKVSYQSVSDTYAVDINGIQQPPQKATFGEVPPPVLDLGNGLTLDVYGKPRTGDVFFFEVVPRYQGGSEDRLIQVADGKTLPGNVSGSELIEGTGSLGRNVNILGALAALRGALLRADPTEVSARLDQIHHGRAQVSDLQAITGIRSIQVEATHAVLTSDEATLKEAKANNSEVDLFDIMSRLQQASQAMQFMATTERQVLNTSLMDFIR